MKKHTFCALALSFALMIGVSNPAEACTSAVISGKITPDGRPLLWKNRDTDNVQNAVKYFSGEKYAFIGIVNSVDNPTEIWIGTNTAGFAIMNTQSYNLVDVQPGEERGEANGSDFIFPLTHEGTVNDTLQHWAKVAGITKHISFHVARHTHATMMLTLGADLYTVSKLLGHKNIATTQIYAKIVDKKKEEAIGLIPNLTD